MAFNYPSLMAIVVNRVDERERVAALSSFTMFFELGSVVGGLALGGVGEMFGKRTGFAGGIVCCAVGLVVLWTRVVVPPSTSRWTSPSTHRSSVTGDWVGSTYVASLIVWSPTRRVRDRMPECDVRFPLVRSV